jgi:hypothetical protein
MPFQVCSGATLTCRFGTVQSFLKVVAPDRQVAPSKASATILDHQPLTNIQPFGLCQSLTNPVVASITTAVVNLETLKPALEEKIRYVGYVENQFVLVSFLQILNLAFQLRQLLGPRVLQRC